MNSQETRTDITKRLAAFIADGCPPWRQPWGSGKNSGIPCNFVTGKHYRGVNPLLLMASAGVHRFSSKYWGSEKQWTSLGAMIKASPKYDPDWATRIVFSTTIEKDSDSPIKGTKDRFFFMRYYQVYNVDQVFAPLPGEIMASHALHQRNLAKKTLGESPKKLTAQQAEQISVKITSKLDAFRVGTIVPDGYEEVQEFVKSVPADIRQGGNRATYWSSPLDYIDMPPMDDFDNPSAFYETLYHELIHWGEADHRKGKRPSFRENYAFSELVAEIGACFLAAETGLPLASTMLPQSASYLNSWLKSMGEDSRFVFEASRQSSLIVDYLLNFRKSSVPTGA